MGINPKCLFGKMTKINPTEESRIKKGILLLLLANTLLLAPIAAVQGVEIPNPLRANDFNELVEGIINFIFNIALAVAPIMIIVAGFVFVTSGGDRLNVQRAKDIMIYTVAGLFVILISKGLITMIRSLF